MPLRPHAVASSLVLLALVACSSTRLSSVEVPPPQAPLALGLAVDDGGPPRFTTAVNVRGVLEVVETDRETGDLRLAVRDGTRRVTVTLSRALEPALAAPWRGRVVQLEASVGPAGTDLALTDAEGNRLLLLVVSRRFDDRLPTRAEDWGTPQDLPLRRVTGASVLRTTGDLNDCVALSVHYPLEIPGGPTPLRLPLGAWQPATWRGHVVAFLNCDSWAYRRSSCPGLEGAGFTLVVRDAPEAAAPAP